MWLRIGVIITVFAILGSSVWSGSAVAEGSAAGVGIVSNHAISTNAYPTGKSSDLEDLIHALSLFWKYHKQVEAEGDTDAAHEKAAYQWGYEVGNPTVIRQARILGEMIQANVIFTPQLGFHIVTFGLVPDPGYRSFSIDADAPGGVIDSLGDIERSVQGATDRQNGLPSKY